MNDNIFTQLESIRRVCVGLRGSLAHGADEIGEVINALSRIITDHAIEQPPRIAGRTDIAAEIDYWRRYEAALTAGAEPKAGNSNSRGGKVDTAAIEHFLRGHFSDATDLRVTRAALATVGFSKKTILLTLDGDHSLPRELVLRVDQATFNSTVKDEYPMLCALAESDVFAPQPLVLEPSGSVIDGAFIVFARSPGIATGYAYFPPHARDKVATQLAQVLARIHALPVERFQPLVPDVSERLAEGIGEFEARWRALDIAMPLVDAAFVWLTDHIDDALGARCLVHNDFAYQNFLFDGDKLTAVLDWEFSHIGNPAQDLGYHAICSYPEGGFDLFLAAYQAAGGTLPSAAALTFFKIYGHLRLAVFSGEVDAIWLGSAQDNLKSSQSWPIWMPKAAIGLGELLQG